AQAQQAVRLVCTARKARRFRGARQPTRRSRVSATRAGSGRGRPSQSACARRTPVTRRRYRTEVAPVTRCRRALRGIGDAVGFGGLTGAQGAALKTFGLLSNESSVQADGFDLAVPGCTQWGPIFSTRRLMPARRPFLPVS